MSHGYLHTMLDMLTGAYNRDDVRNAYSSLPLETNIGRLFNTLAWGLELVHDQSDKILLWDDLDNAQGRGIRPLRGELRRSPRRGS